MGWSLFGRKRKAQQAFNAVDLAEPWLREHGFNPSSVMFSSYDDPGLARHPGSTVLVGTGPANGRGTGFVLEVDPSSGVTYGVILEPEGIATWHRQAAMEAKAAGVSLSQILEQKASAHRS